MQSIEINLDDVATEKAVAEKFSQRCLQLIIAMKQIEELTKENEELKQQLKEKEK